ncbi:ABC transporter ATP-binding protein [Rhodococcus sp. 1R11]|uniref:ABC transporter ATP-binding protein n=1 Tax=unclassified Rhodococcus (in: high G+C Gram-positive bacteria) TaxID=192944 RepID=UPI001072BD31|nr:ABC transporter ATP-binding protein [Rhodococcus sp. 1R11]TFI43688.1 ABC transporter ATP-binding protein [Rhodococcus sp. 1R11]
MPIIEVTHLSKRYAGGRGVDDVSFAVDEGEIFGILGPNGAGKSTTVECIGGLRVRDGGHLRVAGHDPGREPLELRKILGIQLQESVLPDKMRVGEAMELFASFYDRPANTDELIERLGLGKHRKMFFANLSGGQKQRLAIGIALVGRPRVAILDELTTGLDPQARHEVWSLLEDLRSTGLTLLLVSHFMEEAQRLCDRVAVIADGTVAALGSPAELAARGGSAQIVSFIPSGPVDVEDLRVLSSVTDVDQHGLEIRVAGNEDVLDEVLAALRSRGVRAAHVRVDQPTLDDAFVSLVTDRKADR